MSRTTPPAPKIPWPITPLAAATPTRQLVEAELARAVTGLLAEARVNASAQLTVLDVGCGSGEYRFLFPGCRYLGLDLADREFAAKSEPGRGFALADAMALPVASGTCHIVLCAYALDRFPDPAGAMAEFARVLAPGGSLLVAAPSPLVRWFDAPLFAARKLGLPKDVELSGQTNRSYFTRASLSALAREAGLQLQLLTPLGGPWVATLKTAWLWSAFAAYLLKLGSLRSYEKLLGVRLPRKAIKRRGVRVYPKRRTRHARDAAEFRSRMARAACRAGLWSALAGEITPAAHALDQRMFPGWGSEFVAVCRKPDAGDSLDWIARQA